MNWHSDSTMTRRGFLSAAAAVAGAAGAAQEPGGYGPAPAVRDAGWLGRGVQRTMGLLEAGGPVKVLFYGQSITKQDWWKDVAADLRARYPKAEIQADNLAIGGYDAARLVKTLPADVFPYYPDLMIFHDYGSEEIYERMIEMVRRNTTAEILLQSDHVTWLPGSGGADEARQAERRVWHDRHSFEWLPALAKKHELGLVDIRGAWYDYLAAGKFKPSDLLRDSVHLNAHGNHLYAAVTKQYLRRAAGGRGAGDDGGRVRTLRVGQDVKWRKGRLAVEFEGNRVEAVGASGAKAEVWVDGKRPSECAELLYHTRPSNTWSVDWPMVMRVLHEKPLVEEEWRLKVVEKKDDDSWFRFEVTGSKTGADGEGTSAERFVSRSGRVVLEPADWDVTRARSVGKKPMPVGFEVKWSVKANSVDRYGGGRERLVSGLANGKHRLELVASGGARGAEMRELRVYRPG